MTNDEYSSLVAKIGEDETAWCIDKQDSFVMSFRTILKTIVSKQPKEFTRMQGMVSMEPIVVRYTYDVAFG